MKFIHTGDIHYGMSPDSDRAWAKERADAVRESITGIVNECRRRNVDCLFIAGDLFHRQPVMRELKEVNYLFSTIPDVHIVIIAGNHDHIQKNSYALSFPWSPNVRYISSESLSSVYFADINTEVCGFSYHSTEIKDNKLAGIRAAVNGRINILLAHGGDALHLPFDTNELADAGFAYCALGHIHKHKVMANNTVAFCGSPEPLDMTESGVHGCIYGEIDPASCRVSDFEFIPVSSVQYIPLIVNITPSSTNAELLMSISSEINKRGSGNIYRFKIRGMRDPDIEFDLNMLLNKLRIAEILDESEPDYDFCRLLEEHPADMIGFFIRELNKPDMSELDKKALYYGINALLRTTDERSGR